jgi:hypothetical protein
MDVRYLIVLFFLVSCMPSPEVGRGNLENTETTGGTNGGTDGSAPTSTSWNYLGSVTRDITINVSNLNNAYLVGTPVESYLSSSENFTGANYCLVSSYSIGGVSYELRSRIVPISYYDYKQNRTVKILRVDFQDVTNSSSFCNHSLRVLSNTGNLSIDTSGPATHQYDSSLICPSCTSIFSANRVRLFKRNTSSSPVYLDEVPTNLIQTSHLSLQVDPNYAVGGGSGSCTNSQCRAIGYDCCLDNQCVNDGSVKPAAATQYASLLQTAEAERLQNPLAYLNYPQLYYICGSSIPTTTTGSSGGGNETVSTQLKKDIACIEHLKAQANTSPFHLELLSRSYTGTTDCLTSSGDSSQTYYYQNVIKRLYATCGCAKTELSDMISSCPNYEYNVVARDSSNQPIQVECYTPPVNTPTVPSQQTVSVNSRSAPHRFFNESGTEFTNPATSSEDQEGDKFEYLDESKIFYSQNNFSMNAVLGQMSVSLDQALPAKVVNVELDQIYFLQTTSGHYTPCPTCAKDSWFSTFSAFPSSSTGAGLQAVGHTTTRDEFSTNTTAGNYEDTIFGRACWLPPTMIPYSHSSNTDVQEQRKNRLKTQAALFVNGYQRDWFGFNKGALIGSFDGVTWFAVGKGRIVRSTSKKLYLAINAPFADLANPTNHVVNVVLYDGITQAPQVDYDPEYHQTHPYQNEAGNCQKYHMCSTDTDCVTQLGWEYACADVKDLKTSWPEFDGEGKEKAATSVTKTLDQILHQKGLVGNSTKRCVYRGAGALCQVNSGSVSASDLNKRKLLTCAPNFYCANVGAAQAFNSKIARFAAHLEELPVSRNHLFGKDANILGRPLSYVSSGESTSLPNEVRSALVQNLVAFESTATANTGLCQPGKNLPTTSNQTTLSNPFTQHLSADTSKRADFINQIASCNSGLFTSYRHSSCPVIGADGNYEHFASTALPSGYLTRATNQNACGLETVQSNTALSLSVDNLQNFSPFRSIEAKPLNSQIILDKTLVRDACLRRAGAVCHTDLDCSPNKLHASQVDFFSTSYFGNQAEKNYYSEYLVCGQTDPKPHPSDTTAFKNYDMTKNRCCREVGNDITTFTADLPTDTAAGNYDSNTVGLKMSVAPGIAPNDPKRYSRLATVENVGASSSRPVLSAYQERTGTNFLANNPSYTLGTNVMSGSQWKTLNEANSETCCGGGWIRKFSDGSTDWTRRDRVYLDVTNFRCINSRTPLITNPSDVASQYSSSSDPQILVDQDYADYCKDATNTNGACAQFSIVDTTSDIIPEVTAATTYTSTTVNTLSPVYTSSNKDFYFMPRSADGHSAVTMVLSSSSGRRNIQIRIPSFVPRSFDSAYAANTLSISLVASGGSTAGCIKNAGFNPTTPTQVAGGASGDCYFSYDSTNRVLKVGGDSAFNSARSTQTVGVRFTVTTPGAGIVVRTKPGSTAYYLKRLGQLELSGIPQITHEALMCNDNANRIVPGIFDPSVRYLNDPVTPSLSFTNSNYSFRHSYTAKDSSGTVTVSSYFTNQHGLQLDPVFSANDFKCCAPLGKTVSSISRCCSGYGVSQTSSNTAFTCALPPGTDLMVYFNRFVSNEGVGSDKPGGGLTEADFDSRTGEPLLTPAVNDKIRELGTNYCSSGRTRQGGAFGSFEPEPQGPSTNVSQKIYNIVDSSNDAGTSSNAGRTVATGYTSFTEGFRWNHHLYCDD